jgi:prepilin-type processing-associated H-X9-DG protein
MSVARSRGVTLIEWFTGAAIVCTVAAILLPSYIRATESARQQTCLSNVRQISAALNFYAEVWDDTFPLATRLIWVSPTNQRCVNWQDVLGVADLHCAARRPQALGFYGARIIRVQRETIVEPWRAALVSDGVAGLGPDEDGEFGPEWFPHLGSTANVGWHDGHVSLEGAETMHDPTIWPEIPPLPPKQ